VSEVPGVLVRGRMAGASESEPDGDRYFLDTGTSRDISEPAVVRTVAGFSHANSIHRFGVTRFGTPGVCAYEPGCRGPALILSLNERFTDRAWGRQPGGTPLFRARRTDNSAISNPGGPFSSQGILGAHPGKRGGTPNEF
jgi:hypothetical protein